MNLFRKCPVILLPGTGCNQLLWQKLLPFLSKDCQYIMPNLLSCLSQSEMLNTLYKLPFKQFTMVGFSMGGYLAQHFYAQHPERISRLVLICASGEAKSTSETQIQRTLSCLLDESYLSQMIDTSNLLKKETLYTELVEMLKQVGSETVKRQLYATQHRTSVLEKITSGSVPTLVIGAENDKLVPQSHTERLASALGTKPTWVKDSGHMLPLEQPKALAVAVNEWLAQHLVLFTEDDECFSHPSLPASYMNR